jgi:ligand-binding sensor domain-containing protein/AraC-like DNA-binding protein
LIEQKEKQGKMLRTCGRIAKFVATNKIDMNYLRPYICLLLLFFSLGTFALPSTVRWLNRENGLGGSSVFSFYKDNDGIMFIGMETGLAIYDGQHVENVLFRGNEYSGLAWVHDIEEMDSQHLLLATRGGLFSFNKTTHEVKRVFDDQVNFEVNELARTEKGDVFIATRRGLFCYKGQQLLKVNSFGRFNSACVNGISIAKTSQGEMISIVYDSQLIEMQTSNWKKTRSWKNPKQGDRLAFKYVVGCQDGRIMVATEHDGVVVLDSRTGQWAPYARQGEKVNWLFTDGKTYLLVATANDGVMEYDLKTDRLKQQFANKPGDIKMRVRYNTPNIVYRDKMGLTWIGYIFFGADYTTYNRHTFNDYKIPGIFDSAGLQVRSFLVDGDRVLIGTRDGLYITDRKLREAFFWPPEKLGAHIVSQIYRFGDLYFIGTITGGVLTVDANTLQRVRIKGEEAFSEANIYKIDTDRKGNVWLSSSAGVGRYDPKTREWKQYSFSNSQLLSNEVFCFGFDASGQGWISTWSGLCSYNAMNDEISTGDLPKGIVTLGRLSDVYQVGKQSVFIPQLGFPAIYNPTTGQVKRMKFPIYNDEPVSLYLAFLGNNCYIYATQDELYRISPKGIRKFGAIDGLDNLEFQNRSVKVIDNQLWIATGDGLKVANIDDLMADKYPHVKILPNIIITDHLFTQKETAKALDDSTITLSRHNGDLMLQFSPQLYASNLGITYLYRLNGHDDWRVLEKGSNRIAYHDLNPGSYVFELQAFGMPEINLRLKVDVPLSWAAISWIFFIVFVLLLGGHILYCHKYKKPYIWNYFMPKPKKYQTSSLDDKEAKRLSKALKDYMEKKKPYTDSNLQAADVAKALGCKTHELTQVITQVMHTKYYDLIAEYRVREFQRICEDPRNDALNVSAMMEKSGFNSRTAFLTAFKKIVGMPPSEYVKKVRLSR